MISQLEKEAEEDEEVYETMGCWCTTNDNLIATGSNDTFVKIFDVRRALEYDQNKQ